TSQTGKSPAKRPGFDSGEQRLRQRIDRAGTRQKARNLLVDSGRGELRHDAFQWLEGLLGEIGIEPCDLLRLSHEGLVGGFRIFGLHFDRLVERAYAGQLLDEWLRVFKRLLAVIA